MFKKGLNIHQYTKTALPERMMKILEPSFQQEVKATAKHAESSKARNRGRRIGIYFGEDGGSCKSRSPLVKFPNERMEIKGIVAEQSTIKYKFFVGSRN